ESSSSTCSRAPATENCTPLPGAEAVPSFLRRPDLFIEASSWRRFSEDGVKKPYDFRRVDPRTRLPLCRAAKYGGLTCNTLSVCSSGRVTCLPTALGERADIRRRAGAVPTRVWKKEVSEAEKSSLRRDGRLQSLIPVRFEA